MRLPVHPVKRAKPAQPLVYQNPMKSAKLDFSVLKAWILIPQQQTSVQLVMDVQQALPLHSSVQVVPTVRAQEVSAYRVMLGTTVKYHNLYAMVITYHHNSARVVTIAQLEQPLALNTPVLQVHTEAQPD